MAEPAPILGRNERYEIGKIVPLHSHPIHSTVKQLEGDVQSVLNKLRLSDLNARDKDRKIATLEKENDEYAKMVQKLNDEKARRGDEFRAQKELEVEKNTAVAEWEQAQEKVKRLQGCVERLNERLSNEVSKTEGLLHRIERQEKVLGEIAEVQFEEAEAKEGTMRWYVKVHKLAKHGLNGIELEVED